jgi:hypothetical protein
MEIYIMTTTSKTARVLNALMAGETLTPAQITARFGAANPHDVVYKLRRQGYAVYLNKGTLGSRGRRKADAYRLGTPSREVVAAGYRALAAM